MSDTPKSVTQEQFAEIAAGGKAVIIDERPKPAYDKSDQKIPGTDWRNFEQAGEWASELPDGAEVIVYCIHGHEKSQGAALALTAAGVDAAYLEGGFEGYIAAGGKTADK